MSIREVHINTPEYPAQLYLLKDAPKTLYFSGNYEVLLSTDILGIVGSRKMSIYGEQCIKHILNGFSMTKSVTVVSGFVQGVDACAQSYALERGFATLGIMPGGPDVYPWSLHNLYNKILSNGGCFISEYPSGTNPCKWMFVRRNRLIAVLSKAVIVIEAAKKSGSLITADYAKKYGIPVYAVPGNIFNLLSQGTLHLLKSFARPIVSARDLKEIPVSKLTEYSCSDKLFNGEVSTKHLQIIKILSEFSCLTPAELSEHLNISSKELSIHLTYLMSHGYIEEKDGLVYVVHG